MLRTERNTRTMERAIRRAVASLLGHSRFTTVYEHGHWWAIVRSRRDDDEIIYDVVDAEGPGTVAGFGLERIG